MDELTRRRFLRLGVCGGAGLGLAAALPGGALAARPAGHGRAGPDLRPGLDPAGPLAGVSPGAAADPLEVARAAGRWLAARAIETDSGLTWSRVPAEGDEGDLSLYHGSPGGVLYFLELHTVTGDGEAARVAERGADHLVAALRSGDPLAPGLYTGLAGLAYTLDLAHRVTGAPRYREAARAAVDRIVDTAREAAGGVTWFEDDPANASSDIVSGASGIGLTLLALGERWDHEPALDTARAAARHLARIGTDAGGGRKWAMMPSVPRFMPNFSHGTAGAGYFLARVHGHAAEAELLDAAIAGARYLEAVSRCEDGGCLVFHHEPEGEDLFYLSWCHGPVGTARLFHQLATVTGGASWSEWVFEGARGIRNMGVPERRSPGFWNNVSQCCGDTGVGEFFLSLHALTGDEAHLEYARRIAENVAGRADDPGADERKWTQAEHRVQPELLQAQTGWMQGAAGVGAFYLHLAARERGEAPLVVLPDSPWG